MSSKIDVIKAFIMEEFPQADGVQLTGETRLVDEEVIDSLGIFLIVGYLQDQFNVQIGPEDVTLENFATMDSMVKLVDSKTSQS